MKKIIILIIFVLNVFCFAWADNASEAKNEEDFLVAQKVYNDGFYDVAVNLFEKFISKYPGSLQAYKSEIFIGKCLYDQNRFLDALKKFESILNNSQAKPVHDSALFWIAEVYFKSNNFAKAEEFYAKLSGEYPKSEYIKAVNYSLGLSLLQEQKYKQAMEKFTDFEKNFAQDARNYEVSLKILECIYNLKDYPLLKLKTRAYLKDYVQSKSSLVFYYFYLAEAEYYLGNLAEAISNYELIIKGTSEPNIVNISRLSMAWSYLKLKQYDSADKIFSLIAAGQLDKKNLAPYYFGLAILNYELGKYQQSKNYYDKLLLEVADDNLILDAYFGKASSLYNLGEYQQAALVYKKALKELGKGPDNLQWKEKFYSGLIDSLSKYLSIDLLNAELSKLLQAEESQKIKNNILLGYVDILDASGDYAKSLVIYKQLSLDAALESKKDFFYFKVYSCLFKLGGYREAEDGFLGFEKNFKGSEYIDDALYNLVLLKFEKKDYSNVLDLCDDFKNRFSKSSFLPAVMFLKARGYEELGKFEEAKNTLKQINSLFSDDLEVIKKSEFELALCLFKMDKQEEALNKIKLLRGKYADNEYNAQILWWLGKYYYDKNEYSMALRYFSSIVSDYPKSQFRFNSFYAIGMILSNNPDTYKMAEDNLRKVFDSNKDMAFEAAKIILKIYVAGSNDAMVQEISQDIIKRYADLEAGINSYVGQLYYEKSDVDKAIVFFEKNKSKDLAALFTLGEIFQTRQELDKAVACYKNIVDNFSQQNPLFLKSLLRLASIYEDQNDIDKAMEIYEKIKKMNIPESEFAKEKIENLGNNIKN
jgi:TolA-binding protein